MKLTLIIISLALLLPALSGHQVTVESALLSPREDGPNQIALHRSDGTAPAIGLGAVNAALSQVGVRVSRVSIPNGARHLLRTSKMRALKSTEADDLIRWFHLDRRELLQEIVNAGRSPAMPRGGFLRTSEVDVPPYPKVYDMQALDDQTVTYLQAKFGRLHVNSSDSGVGIDEVMTIVSGGPYTWFFVLEDNVVGKLRLGTVEETGKAWRISYPGLVPHGGYFDAADGLVVAYAHGPKHFVMRYEDPSVKGFESLGDNPWIDFSSDTPRLLAAPRATSSTN